MPCFEELILSAIRLFVYVVTPRRSKTKGFTLIETRINITTSIIVGAEAWSQLSNHKLDSAK
jgi:hypothetical protein